MAKTITYQDLKTLRERARWSRAELARRASMHPSTIGQIESGRLAPYPSQTERILEALGNTVRPDE